jgi:hypothetical protein
MWWSTSKRTKIKEDEEEEKEEGTNMEIMV